ncbi:delta(1)-pyrroline-2-carboxylate reductase family protein [Affinibrenneria salicis]|uniref:Delta(1)-pyrroline-2-carboxylate reductase family protein n=1 Tax=Affinibrenneria salicis TaxID=2590031 RepID=A0A5J5G4A0_9GAMM|nr:bifunctional Delta(1)-pyrroline-2-carboxylate/Delta(1)-piperideine-2-carboxylate reductase [Affinibrenneria salicis]KAA9001877.1 delta(1)-pyrroline-2-carboxylate reductase family protein [Affinibrenneria salicis]
MNNQSYITYNRAETAKLLNFSALVDAIAQAAEEYAHNGILSPERLVVPMENNAVMLSMPAIGSDIAIHKLVNVVPDNGNLQLPTIHGLVTVFNAQTGVPLFVLDGPEVTGRRTAAVSMLGIRTFLPRQPQAILLIGTGTQSAYHLQAIAELYPASKVWVRGSRPGRAEAFCEKFAALHPALSPCPSDGMPHEIDVVITLTTSKVAIYNDAARPNLLVIGVGAFKPDMAEIGAATLAGSDIYVDDPDGARQEAGDLIQAGVDWSITRPLISALKSQPEFARPVVFKTVGTGAWDLAAGRVARAALAM